MKGSRILSIFILIFVCINNVEAQKTNKNFRDLNKNGKLDNYENPKLPNEQRIVDLLQRMTLEEKVGQLAFTLGWNYYTKTTDSNIQLTETFKNDIQKRNIGGAWATLRADPWTQKTLKTGLSPREAAETVNAMQRYVADSSRLGIPFFFAEECPHGHMAIGTTVFPTAIGRASTWNTELEQRAGAAIAEEARLQGAHIGYGPVIDIARELRWSRVEEDYGEDPILAGTMGAALVKGFQGESINSGRNVISTLKHFTAYGVPEGGHNAGMAHVGMRELLTELSYPFEIAVKAGALSVMTAYNEVDGVPCSANPFLTNELLRNQWNFRGFTVSDLYSIDGLVSQRVAANRSDAAALALQSGLDADLGANCYGEPLIKAVKENKISEEIIDKAVSRILRMKFEMGLFENPYVDSQAAQQKVGSAANRAIALEVARQSIILLKNEKGTLPLSKNIKSVAVIGANADNVYNQLGDYTAPQAEGKIITVLKGIQNKLPNAKINYAKGCAIRDTANVDIEAACAAARKSDVAIVVLGGSSARDFSTNFLETGAAITNVEKVSDMESGEGFDRVSLSLMGKQLELLKAVCATGKPVVLVMIQGRPLDLTWPHENVPAILNAWYPGCEGGNAIADVIFGDVNPAGRLPLSYPRNVGQLPVFYNHKSRERNNYVEGSSAPLYPFGFGLSYTTFEYTNLTATVTGKNSVKINLTVKNTGTRAGDEVVQLYVHDNHASVVTPFIQLKAFKRITLAPNESKQVEFYLDEKDLRILNRKLNWEVEAGTFTVLIGASSQDIRLKTKFEIK